MKSRVRLGKRRKQEAEEDKETEQEPEEGKRALKRNQKKEDGEGNPSKTCAVQASEQKETPSSPTHEIQKESTEIEKGRRDRVSRRVTRMTRRRFVGSRNVDIYE